MTIFDCIRAIKWLYAPLPKFGRGFCGPALTAPFQSLPDSDSDGLHQAALIGFDQLFQPIITDFFPADLQTSIDIGIDLMPIGSNEEPLLCVPEFFTLTVPSSSFIP